MYNLQPQHLSHTPYQQSKLTIQDQEDLLLKYLMNVLEEGMALIQVVSELKDGNDLNLQKIQL